MLNILTYFILFFFYFIIFFIFFYFFVSICFHLFKIIYYKSNAIIFLFPIIISLLVPLLYYFFFVIFDFFYYIFSVIHFDYYTVKEPIQMHKIHYNNFSIYQYWYVKKVHYNSPLLYNDFFAKEILFDNISYEKDFCFTPKKFHKIYKFTECSFQTFPFNTFLHNNMLKIKQCNSNLLTIDNQITLNAYYQLELKKYFYIFREMYNAITDPQKRSNNMAYLKVSVAIDNCITNVNDRKEELTLLQSEKNSIINIRQTLFRNIIQATRIMENMNIKALKDIHSLPDFDTSSRSRQL